MPGSLELKLKQIALSAAIWAALSAHPAHATLGEPESTVAAEAQQLKVSVKATQRTGYRMHEMQLPSGTRLREFADTGGTVFAVDWTGPSKPDLRQALGKYFDVYVAAAKTRRAVRSPLRIREPGFAMDAGGHMRAFTGRAYLPGSVPAGTSVDDLR